MKLPTINSSKNHWTIHDVILLSLIAIFFGIIYQVWNYAYYALAATPFKPYANDLTLGVWLMAGPLSALLLKKRNACFIGEILAAIIEMFIFSSWGVNAILAGAIQGLGSEIGFALCKYHHFDKFGLFISTITTTIVTFTWDLFQSGYANYPLKMLEILFLIRFISIGVFAAILVALIQRLLIRTKVLQ